MSSSDSELNRGEIIIYSPNNNIRIEVKHRDETLWLTQGQMGVLFGVDRTVIVRHIGNIYKCGELEEESTCAKNAQVQKEGARQVIRSQKYYNLDMILSVGYRVNSKNATSFRKWATSVLKEYLLKGYLFEKRFDKIENRLSKAEEKIEYLVQTNLPPVEGIFFDGQIFDAYKFINDLIRRANTEIILIDNYINDEVLTILDKRKDNVSAIIYIKCISHQLRLDLSRHNEQYREIDVRQFGKSHDRFLIIDNKVYHIGASLKDLVKKWFAFSLLQDIDSKELISSMQ